MKQMVSVNITGVKEALDRFDPRIIKKAVNSTLKKLGRTAKTAASAKIREGYRIKKQDLDRAITIRAQRDDLSVTLTVTGKRIGAYKFGGAKQIRTTKRISGLGTTIEIQKGKKKFIRSGFIAAMPSGHIGVFVRAKKGATRVKRLPIHEIWGPSIAELFGDQIVLDEIQRQVNEQVKKIFDHELEFYLSQKT